MDTDTTQDQGTDQEPGNENPNDQLESPKPGEDLSPEEAAKAEADSKAAAQDSINKAINKKHRQMMEAKEETEAANRRAEKLQQQVDTFQQQQIPEVPELPDIYDPQYSEKMAYRDKAIQTRNTYENQQNFMAQQAEQRELQAHEEARVRAAGRVSKFQANVAKLGLKQEDIVQAEQTVGTYIQSQDVKNFLLEDDDGAVMVQFLANNPVVLEQVSQMSPMVAASYLKMSVAPEAIKLVPPTTTTPDPDTLPKQRGGGNSPSILDGATFT